MILMNERMIEFMSRRVMFVVAILVLTMLAAVGAYAEATDTGTAPDVSVGEPLTWTYLATIACAAAFTLLVVQFLKAPLDKVWKIPTRVFAYVVALGVMLVATAFTTGLTVDNALLVGVNALLAALSAYGAYEVTFGKIENS